VPTEHLIDVHDLAKTFRSKLLRRPHVALRGLDLAVREGEIFGFLGPNGAGKTTTIKILLGLLRPTSGTGHVLGHPFTSVAARRSVGFLPDSPNFYRYLTARELLDFAGRLHGLDSRELPRRIESALDRVGLDESARGRALRGYSRGMLQRTGIAAAILHRPRLVILDEPMNGLDPLGRGDFRDLILALRDEGVTIFLSSHVLGDIENMADRVGILHEGHLIRCGALGDILAGDERRVEILFELDPGTALAEVAPSFEELAIGPQGRFGVVRDPRRAEWVVRRILDGGGRLLRYDRRRVSLEEFFVREISGARTPAPNLPAPGEAPVRSDPPPSSRRSRPREGATA